MNITIHLGAWMIPALITIAILIFRWRYPVSDIGQFHWATLLFKWACWAVIALSWLVYFVFA